ncbi:hypothetical protein BaRGS_00024062 [Batillaria attramentaria]|uniref:Uncharacterized protein n=1 Tax=Batillaria attramentaria TaxID=370345 RepID=A0ABD0KC06_9CAEN
MFKWLKLFTLRCERTNCSLAEAWSKGDLRVSRHGHHFSFTSANTDPTTADDTRGFKAKIPLARPTQTYPVWSYRLTRLSRFSRFSRSSVSSLKSSQAAITVSPVAQPAPSVYHSGRGGAGRYVHGLKTTTKQL